MKTLLITDSLARGGKERRMLELIKGFKGYPDVSCELVIFSKRIDYPEIHDMEVPLHVLERKPKKDPRVFGRFFALCKRAQPDIIHSWGAMPSVYAVPTARSLGIPLVNAMITDAPAHMKPWDARRRRGWMTFPFSDMVLGNSQAGLTAYRAPEDRSHCVYNGFDFRRLEGMVAPVDVRARLEIRTPNVIGMVGAFEARKDYETYLRAAIKVAEQRDDVTFLAIGDGPTRPASEALVPEALRARIRFTGLQTQVESIVQTFTLGVLATDHLRHGEGISNAILEYMALGKPVVATEGGGTAEIVSHNETGLLVPPAKPDMMATAICQLLDDPAMAQRMGTAGLARVHAEFDLSQMTHTYYQLYQQALTKHGVYSH